MKWKPWPLLTILLAFIVGYEIGSFRSKTSAKPVSQNEWRQAPHEQQSEPMMAQAVGGVERWLL